MKTEREDRSRTRQLYPGAEDLDSRLARNVDGAHRKAGLPLAQDPRASPELERLEFFVHCCHPPRREDVAHVDEAVQHLCGRLNQLVLLLSQHLRAVVSNWYHTLFAILAFPWSRKWQWAPRCWESRRPKSGPGHTHSRAPAQAQSLLPKTVFYSIGKAALKVHKP